MVLFFAPLRIFASVDIVADTPSGTYHAPVHITLTPTESGSKTFYSFKPDGYPTDAFLYTGAILLKHSSPLIYFSIISPTNESKIKQNDYVIEYSSDVRFETESVSGSGKVEVVLVNAGSGEVNAGFWQVQSESDTIVIPEGTVIAPWEKYSLRLSYPGTSSVVLRSPDDDEKDILVPNGIPSKSGAILPKKRSTVVRIVPRKIISTRETSPSVSSPISGSPEKILAPTEERSTATIPSSEWTVSFTETLLSPPSPAIQATESIPAPIPDTSAVSRPNTPDINRVVKVSTNESGQSSTNPLYLVALLVLSAGIGGVRWMSKKK